MVDDAFETLSAIDSSTRQLTDLHKLLGNLYLRRGSCTMAVGEFIPTPTVLVLPRDQVGSWSLPATTACRWPRPASARAAPASTTRRIRFQRACRGS